MLYHTAYFYGEAFGNIYALYRAPKYHVLFLQAGGKVLDLIKQLDVSLRLLTICRKALIKSQEQLRGESCLRCRIQCHQVLHRAHVPQMGFTMAI